MEKSNYFYAYALAGIMRIHLEISNKINHGDGITYDQDVLRLMDDLHYWDLKINSVLTTRYTRTTWQHNSKSSLERRGIKVYTHGYTEGYRRTLKPSLVTQD